MITDEQIWPDPASRPPAAMRQEIRREAELVTAEDIAGYPNLERWYAPYFVAQCRVAHRLETATREQTPDLHRRVAKLERWVGQGGGLIKAIGTAMGQTHRELDDARIKAQCDLDIRLARLTARVKAANA